MLSAESKLPKNRRSDWTHKLQQIVYKIRYFKILLQKLRGIPITDRVLDKVGEKAGETLCVDDEAVIQKHLKEAWNSLVLYKKKTEEERKKFLLECIKEKDKSHKNSKKRQSRQS